MTRIPITIAASERSIEFHLLAQPARLAAGAELRLDVGSEAPILRPLVFLSGFSHEYYRLDGSTSALVFLVTSALIEKTTQVRDLYELTYLWIQTGTAQDATAIPLGPLKDPDIWRPVPAYLAIMVYASSDVFARIAPSVQLALMSNDSGASHKYHFLPDIGMAFVATLTPPTLDLCKPIPFESIKSPGASDYIYTAEINGVSPVSPFVIHHWLTSAGFSPAFLPHWRQWSSYSNTVSVAQLILVTTDPSTFAQWRSETLSLQRMLTQIQLPDTAVTIFLRCPSGVSFPAPATMTVEATDFPDTAQILDLLAPNAGLAQEDSMTQAAACASREDYANLAFRTLEVRAAAMINPTRSGTFVPEPATPSQPPGQTSPVKLAGFNNIRSLYKLSAGTRANPTVPSSHPPADSSVLDSALGDIGRRLSVNGHELRSRSQSPTKRSNTSRSGELSPTVAHASSRARNGEVSDEGATDSSMACATPRDEASL
jgi:hypothetical protein